MTDSQDTELTLGVGTLLGVFFGLVLLCGVFFGLGYSMGRNASGAAPQQAAPAAPANAARSIPKPAAGGADDKAPASEIADACGSGSDCGPAATDDAADAEPAASVPTAEKPRETPRPEPKAQARLKPVSVATRTAAASAARANGPVVQVAAVRRQEDAEVLASALRRKGYGVFVKSQPSDNLLHIQLGPLADRKSAEAMRARLAGDGYNAILK